MLFRVALDKLFINVPTYQLQGLFLQVAGRMRQCRLCPLTLQLPLRLLGRANAPELIEGVHVEGQVIQLSLIIGNGAVGIAVHVNEAMHIPPQGIIVSVENMRPILMDVDAVHQPGIHVAAHMRALFQHQTAFARVQQLAGDGRPGEAGADDQVGIRH